MLAVHVSNAATGEEICVIAAGRDWTAHELNVKLASQRDAMPHSQVLLHGARPLQQLERLHELLDEEEASTLKLQLLRKSWVVTVVDIRPKGSDGDLWHREIDVEAYPECSFEDFAACVAKKLDLEPATRPEIVLAREVIDWRERSTSLATLGIHAGSKVHVIGTANLRMMSRGRPAPDSRRSEFLESNSALCLMDQCQAGELLPNPACKEPPADDPAVQEFKVLHPGQSEISCDSLVQIPGLLQRQECNSIISRAQELAVAPMDVECFLGTRRYQRIVVRDEKLATRPWERA